MKDKNNKTGRILPPSPNSLGRNSAETVPLAWWINRFSEVEYLAIWACNERLPIFKVILSLYL
jgi:hypothetical protein